MLEDPDGALETPGLNNSTDRGWDFSGPLPAIRSPRNGDLRDPNQAALTEHPAAVKHQAKPKSTAQIRRTRIRDGA